MHLFSRDGHQIPGVPLFRTRISGPLLDRIDIHIEVLRVEYDKLSNSRLGESSEAVQVRVEAALQIQRACFVGARRENEGSTQTPPPASSLQVQCNADMHPIEVYQFYVLEVTGMNLMRATMQQLQLSA